MAQYCSAFYTCHAHRVIEQIIGKPRNLDPFPERGRVVPEAGATDIRELFVFSYRMIHEIRERQVLVPAVIHGHRLPENTGRLD